MPYQWSNLSFLGIAEEINIDKLHNLFKINIRHYNIINQKVMYELQNSRVLYRLPDGLL